MRCSRSCSAGSAVNANIVQRAAIGAVAGSAIAFTGVTTPKLSVTSNCRSRYSHPTGSRTGTTNQSLPKVSANSVTLIRSRSVTPASAPAKSTLPSSNSQ